MGIYSLLAIILSVFYGSAIGMNDAANSFADWIGARIGKVKTGLILCGTFAFLGAFFEGGKVIKTIGGGIVPKTFLTPEVAVIGMIAAMLWVFIATSLGMPISTTHSSVGGIGGIGVALILFGMMPAAAFKLRVVVNIIICWLTTPTGSMLIAFLTAFAVLRFIKRFSLERRATKTARILLTFSSSYVAYTWGANDVANSVALIAGSDVVSMKMALIIGGGAIAVGAILFGSRVAETVGFKITRLNPVMGVIADLSTAVTIHFFTSLKMPVSTTHALVGAVAGVGLARRVNLVDFRIVRDITFAWVLTPVVTFVITFVVFVVFRFLNLV